MSSLCNGNLQGSLSVGQGERGKSLEFTWEGTSLGIRVEGQEEFQFTDLGAEGGSGKEIQLQVGNGYIQWKYAAEEEWENLIDISELKGDRGLDGKSAYELWLENGNEGTIDDFLLSLKGKDGEKGEQGIQGLQGEKGEKGDKGDTGEQGLPGINGADGKDGITPNIQIGEVTTLEPGQQATVENVGTKEEPVFNFGIPRGQQGEEGKPPTYELVTTPIIDSTLTLTTDKYQTTIIEDNTTIVLPDVSNYTEIHLFFTTDSELTLILPSIKWQGDISIEANKTYEFIFTYASEWLGGVICYE